MEIKINHLILTISLSFSAIWTLAQRVEDPISVLDNDSAYFYMATYKAHMLGGIEKKYTAQPTKQDTVNIPQRIKNNAKVLSKGGFDMICVQGVVAGKGGKMAIRDMVWGLNKKYDCRYKFIMSGVLGKGSRYYESIAILYDSVTVDRLVGSRVLDVGKGMDFVQTNWRSGTFDFSLVACNFSWGSATYRRQELSKLNEILSNPDKFTKDSDLIIAGNFNRFGNGMKVFKNVEFDSSTFFCPGIQFWDPSFNTHAMISTPMISGRGIPDDDPQLLSSTCEGKRHVYDAIICASDVMEEFGVSQDSLSFNKDFGVISFDQPNGIGYIRGTQKYASGINEDYSDHRPVWMRFSRNGHDLDQ